MIECLGENEECHGGYPYLIVSKKECVNGNYPNLIFYIIKLIINFFFIKNNFKEINEFYEFNKKYYDFGCPIGSYDKNNDKKCVCNSLCGYWYIDKEEYNCALYKCLEEKPLSDE